MKTVNPKVILLILFLFSCRSENKEASVRASATEVDELIQNIQEVEYENVYLMKEYASQLLKIEGNKRAQTIGNAYLKIADFYLYDEDFVLEDLKKVYSTLDSDEYLPLKLKIDLLIVEHYYLGSLYKKAAQRLNYVLEYIFRPEFELEKQVFIYGLISRYNHVDKKERLNKLEKLAKLLESEPWSYLKSKIYFSITSYNYYLKNTEGLKESFENNLEK